MGTTRSAESRRWERTARPSEEASPRWIEALGLPEKCRSTPLLRAARFRTHGAYRRSRERGKGARCPLHVAAKHLRPRLLQMRVAKLFQLWLLFPGRPNHQGMEEEWLVRQSEFPTKAAERSRTERVQASVSLSTTP